MDITHRKNLRFYPLIIVCICLLNSTTTQAQDCHTETLTQTDMNLCAASQTQKADDRLEAVYEKLKTKSSPAGQQKLEEAEQAWSIYRARQCEFNTTATIGGSAHPMLVSECYRFLALQQTKLLQKQLNCEEGDLSCGGQ